MHGHFLDRHLLYMVLMFGEGTYPKCAICGMKTNVRHISQGHKGTQHCQDGVMQWRQPHLQTDVVLMLQQ